MSGIRQQIGSGAWLTAERARAYSLILLVLTVVISAFWLFGSDGLIDRNGKPIGTDFSSFYAAGSLALEGRAIDAYDTAAHYAREQQLFGERTPYYAWFYPPIFLLVAAPLAMLPYWLALAVWQGASGLLYGMTTAAILRRARLPDAIRNTGLLAAIAFPAVLINLGHGQNGFLTAGLFASALLALPKRPILAGILLASMAYKPQFALVIPLALLAARQWQAFASAAAAVIGLIGLTSAIFGIDIWSAFMATGELSRKLLLEQGEVGFAKLQSTFAVARMWSAGIMLAYLLQGLVTAVVIISAAWAWHTTNDTSVRAAILLIAALLASPHVLDYDLMLLGPAIAFMVVAGTLSGFHRYEITLLAAAWAVPLLARPVAEASGISLGWATLIALYIAALQRVTTARQHVKAADAPLAST